MQERTERNNCSYSCGLRVLGAQRLAVRNMNSLHISADFWVLSRFCRSLIIMLCLFQSLCKCHRSLSHESIRKARYFEYFFFFLQQITGVFFCPSCSRGISKKSQLKTRKENCTACSKSSIPYCRSVSVERARYYQQHRESVNMKTFDLIRA